MSNNEGSESCAGEDLQLENALVEYSKTMEDGKAKAFIKRLQDDQNYYLSMGKALSEMAMLIAGSAVIDDEAEFTKMRRRVLFEGRNDDVEHQNLRLYFMRNRDAVDMSEVIESKEQEDKFRARIAAFMEDYIECHGIEA